MPERSIAGSTKNIGKEGRTSQKVASECAAIRSASCVSRQSQIMARIETIGRDAMSAPKAGLRLAVSETAETIIPDIAALRRA